MRTGMSRLARLRALLWAVSLAVPSGIALGGVTRTDSEVPSSSIVQANPGQRDRAAAAVRAVGGVVGDDLNILNGFVADVPVSRLAELQSDAAIRAITPNYEVSLSHAVDGFDGSSEPGSLHNVTKTIRAHDMWRAGFTGRGVDVALIDSGVSPVAGMESSKQVLNGLDISFDSQREQLRHLDLYGHGTHMAGIISGQDQVDRTKDLYSHDTFAGVAPDSRIVNVKVANAKGAADVSQLIAAIDWVVQHRNDAGMNIRVLNLSFGTDSAQDPRVDPLAHAAEVAWRKGIFVVAAAGNQGTQGLTQPALDPFLMAVGADDTKGTADVDDDSVPSWSSIGNDSRNPDVIAPGKSIASLRVKGSYLDDAYPAARTGSRFFAGSGTSQAAAVVSGAAALLLEQRPSISPDQLKALLSQSASRIPNAPVTAQGSGLINLRTAAGMRTPSVTQTFATSEGTGSLEGARGTHHVQDGEGNVLTGEQDIFGNAWIGTSWSGASWAGTSWSGGSWNGTSWSGSCWCGTSWSGTSWSGTSWSSLAWAGTSWSGTSWSNALWDPAGTSWSGTSWSGTSWSGTSWSGTSWSSTSWSAAGTSWSSKEWA